MNKAEFTILVNFISVAAVPDPYFQLGVEDLCGYMEFQVRLFFETERLSPLLLSKHIPPAFSYSPNIAASLSLSQRSLTCYGCIMSLCDRRRNSLRTHIHFRLHSHKVQRVLGKCLFMLEHNLKKVICLIHSFVLTHLVCPLSLFLC